MKSRLLLPILAALALGGCHVKRDPEPAPEPASSAKTCRISNVVYTKYNLQLTYRRTDSLLESASEVSAAVILRSYVYGEGLLVVTRAPFGGNPVLSTDSIWVNAQGMVLRHRVHSDYLPQTQSEAFYTYNAAGELQQKLLVNFASGDSTLTEFSWLNGDPIAYRIDGTSYDIAYDDQRAAMQGDYFHINDLIVYGGYRTLRSRRLVTGMGIDIFDYSFDSDGRISGLLAKGAIHTYNYNCQ